MPLVSDVLAFSRAQAQTDSNGLTNGNGIIWSNEALFDFHRRLINAGVDASQIQESYTDGAVPATEGNGSTFLYPTNMLFLKSIAVNFTDTSAQNYKQATQVDASNLPGGVSFSWLRENASTENPMFDDHGDWFEIFPAFQSSNNISQAIRIMYFLRPTEYTAVSDTIAYPPSMDYRTFGWRICYSYLMALGKVEEAQAFNQEYLNRVKEYIGTLGRGSQQPLQAYPLQISGWEF